MMAITPAAGPGARASRCLVLGGGGFLGGHIVEALVNDGLAVRVFDRAVRHAGWSSSIDWVEGDFGNRGELLAAMEGCEIAIHLVSTTLPKTSNDDPVHDLESNLLATVRFLELARERRMRRVVFASSGGTVYGVPDTVPIPEGHPTSPICSYGIQKLTIERYLHLYHTLHGLEYCVLRLANPFGEGQRPDGTQGAVAVFLDRALRNEPITIWGDGSVVRDYVYVRDVARAFQLAVRRAQSTGVFNIGSGCGLSVTSLLHVIERLLGRTITRRHVEARPFDVPTNVLDIRKAARELLWAPRYSFEEGLQQTLLRLRERPA